MLHYEDSFEIIFDNQCLLTDYFTTSSTPSKRSSAAARYVIVQLEYLDQQQVLLANILVNYFRYNDKDKTPLLT